MIVADSAKSREQLIAELKDLRQWVMKFEKLYEEYESAITTLRSFEKALETMQIGVTITDPKGNIMFINAAELQMHGYTGEELKGASVSIFAPNGKWKPPTKEKIKEMKRWKRKSINQRKDGSLFPVHLMSDIVTDEEGEPIGVVTTCEDITERERMEEEIRERVEELERFYEMSVGREVKMKRLKKEIQKLREEAARYSRLQ